jgi:hypothetical protein
VEESCLSPPSGFRTDQYTLIRLSKVEGRDVLNTLHERIGTVNEVPNIEELSDGSWEICILKSHCCTAQDTLSTIFPGSDVDLKYNPVEPTAKDLKIWDYDTAKELRQRWSFKRAVRIVKNGRPAANHGTLRLDSGAWNRPIRILMEQYLSVRSGTYDESGRFDESLFSSNRSFIAKLFPTRF